MTKILAVVEIYSHGCSYVDPGTGLAQGYREVDVADGDRANTAFNTPY